MDSKIPKKVQDTLYALEMEIQKVTVVDTVRNIRNAFADVTANLEAYLTSLERQVLDNKKKQFWEVEEIAEYLNVTTVTVYTWIDPKKGGKKLEAKYAGSKIRISQEALDKFLDEHPKYRPSPKKQIQKRKK